MVLLRAVHLANISAQDFRLREGNTSGALIDSNLRCHREQYTQQTHSHDICEVGVVIP